MRHRQIKTTIEKFSILARMGERGMRTFKAALLTALIALMPLNAALATISSTTNRVTYTGNGAVDTYAYTFKILVNTDLLVVVRDIATPAVETTLTLTTHYTVTGVGNGSGGNVALVNGAFDWVDGDGDLKTGYTLIFRRVRSLLQSTAIRNLGAYYPSLHEDAFDHQIMVAQQLDLDLDRCIKKRETDDVGELLIPLEADRASKAFTFDASGDPTATALSGVVSGGGGLLAANNLSDVAAVATARANLGATGAHWNAAQLQGEDVSAAAPAGGQLLVYNSASNEWEPADAGPATGGYTAPVSTSLLNGQGVADDVAGMTVDGSLYSSVEFLVEIDRETDTNHVFSVGRLILRFKDGSWLIDRALFSGDADGITFSVQTTVNDAQVQYTSDTLAGASYVGNIKFGRFSFPQ